MSDPIVDLSKCQGCGATVEPVLHSCPYQAEINDDDSDVCNCCENCAYECALEV